MTKLDENATAVLGLQVPETQEDAEPFDLPYRMGRYRIVEKIGEGGMGVVYLAVDTALGREVALKTLRFDPRIDRSDETGARARFAREASWAGRSSHPNVVRIFEQGEEDGRPYITMERLEGEDLKAKLERGAPLPIEERLRIVVEVGKGLEHAHQQGIVHRDVKPGNIFVCTSGDVKVLDFGLAHTAQSRLTRVGQILGTPFYMSPEQILGMPVDARADVFSLGAVLYELVTGQKAFPADRTELASLTFRIVHQEPTAIQIADPEAPEVLARIVRKAMSKKPGDRYQAILDLVTDLERFLLSEEGRRYVAKREGKIFESSRTSCRAESEIPTEILPPFADGSFRTLESDIASLVALCNVLRARPSA